MFSHHTRLASLASQILVVDPSVGFFKACLQSGIRFPIQIFLDERIFAVTAVDALGGAQIVISLQLDAGDAFDGVHQLIDAYGFGGAQIDRFQNLRIGDELDSLDTIVGEHEAAGLIAGTPDFDFVRALELRLDHFAANRRGSFLATAEPGAPGSVNVVKAREAGAKAKILAEVAA